MIGYDRTLVRTEKKEEIQKTDINLKTLALLTAAGVCLVVLLSILAQ